MKEEIKIPQMGESVREATIGAILKPSGSQVNESDELLELETEKVNQVLYAPFAGRVTWNVKTGDTLKVGESLGTIEKVTTAPQEEPPPAVQPAKAVQNNRVEPPPPKNLPPLGVGERVMKEGFIQEMTTPPSEPIIKERVSSVEELIPKREGRESRRKMTKIRQTIAKRLVEALHSSAMLTTFNEVDMSLVAELRSKYKEPFQKRHGVKLGLLSFFIKAVVESLKAFPDVNSYLSGDEIITRHYYDISVAVSTDRGLVVPVIRHCDTLSFAEIEKEIASLALKAREGRLSIQEMEGGGFTITNGGIYGSMLSTPILNPPQVGILGMHKIIPRPVAIDKAIQIRPMMYLALSYDHRLIDGKEAVSFLTLVKEILEDPYRLLLMEEEKSIDLFPN